MSERFDSSREGSRESDGLLPGSESDVEATAEPLSLGHRLRQPRTILSIVIPFILLLLVLRALPGFKLDRLPSLLGTADPLFLLGAFLVYYAGFPLRGTRWAIVLRGVGVRMGPRDSTEIVFLSWLVNCLVPAKLGDVYRAYLLKLNTPVSLTRTFGTIVIERVLDLAALAVLGLGAGYVSFRTGLPPAVRFVFVLGIFVVAGLAVGLFTLRNFGRRLVERLPLPSRTVELYDRFEAGIFAIRARDLPLLGVLTGAIWSTEGVRLFLVVLSFGFAEVHLGISGAFFVALAGSLLTAVPFTPGGFGVVEAGIGALLTIVYGVPPTEAAAIVLVDRAISVISIIVLGAGAYLVSPLRRGAGLSPDRIGRGGAGAS